MNIRLAFWKGEEKDKEKENKEKEKGEEGIYLSCLNLTGKNVMRVKRKDPGLATAFKQQLYGSFSWYFTCVVILLGHYAIGIFCIESTVNKERKETLTNTRKVKKLSAIPPPSHPLSWKTKNESYLR